MNMTCQGFGKTAESVSVTMAFLSKRIGSPSIYYNGQPFTNAAGYGFDTQPHDDCLCVINVGTVQGALATLKNSVLECAIDDPSAATKLSGADFDDINSSGDECVKIGAIKCKDTKRYLFLETESQGSPQTIDFGAVWIGGSARQQAANHSLEFDV
jgi:hypothetical protein